MQVGIAEVDLGPSIAKENALETERALAKLRKEEEEKQRQKRDADCTNFTHAFIALSIGLNKGLR